MFYGIARLEFFIPQSHSLKEKRAILNRIKGRIENRFHLAIAEVEYQDLWQRAALGMALIAQGAQSARDGLQAARREAEQDPRIEVLDFQVRVGSFLDQPAAGGRSDGGEA